MTSAGINTVGNTDNTYEGNPHMEKLFSELVKSNDFKRATSSMVHVMLNHWAGESSAKKWITTPLEKRLKKALLPADNGGSQETSNIADLIDPIAGLMSEMMGRMGQVAKDIEALPAEEKAKIIEKVTANVNTDQMKDMFGSLTRIIRTDERIGIIPMLNAGAKKLLEVVSNFNANFSEDPSEDSDGEKTSKASSSKFDDLDSDTIGKLVNETIKVIKKLQKRTEHMRDPDFLATESDLMKKVEEIGAKIDIGFLMKSRMAIEEYKISFRDWLMS